MDISRERQKTASIIHTRCMEMINEDLSWSLTNWPLPPPPIYDPEFPPNSPHSANQVIEQAEGLFSIDRARFNNLLNECRESMIPHRLNLTSDPLREGEKWLLNRIDDVARRIMFGICEGWIALGLDEGAPDSTRWYIGIALLNGICRKIDGLSENLGYHILESIALSKPPGRWPTQSEPGPHQIDWKENKKSNIQFEGNSAGIDAAHWLLDVMEDGDENRRVLLVKWMRIMLERPILVEQMALAKRFEQMVRGQPENVAAELVGCVPRLLEVSKESGLLVLTSLQTRQEPLVHMAISDALPSLLRASKTEGLALIDYLSKSKDVGARSASVSALKELANLDSNAFLQRIKKPSHDAEKSIRRLFVQSCLRDYLELDPSDSMGIFVPLWIENDEVAGIRMRELLLRMQDVNIDSFAVIAKKISNDSPESMTKFWEVLKIRNEEREKIWKLHLSDNGPPPEPLL